MRTARNIFARKAFTLAELTIGIAVTAMIAGALAAIFNAAAMGWESSETSQNSQITVRQLSAELERMLRDAKYVGLATADNQIAHTGNSTLVGTFGADLMFWMNDTNNDAKMQLSEMALIEHDLTGKTLTIYSVPASASNANVICTNDDMKSTDAAVAFKQLPNVTAHSLVTGATSATFTAYTPSQAATGQRQRVDFVIGLQMSGPDAGEKVAASRVEFGSGTLRAPATQP